MLSFAYSRGNDIAGGAAIIFKCNFLSKHAAVQRAQIDVFSQYDIYVKTRHIILECLTSMLSFVGYMFPFLHYLYLGNICGEILLVWMTCPTVSDAASPGWFTCRGQLRTS